MLAATIFSLLPFLAAPALAQYYNQSAPFNLQVLSTANATINGSFLTACHSGAAIESLCRVGSFSTSNTGFSSFNFNTSTNTGVVYNTTLGEPGYLTYLLRGSNFNESEPLSMARDYSSNVGLPLFEPLENVLVAFDSNDLMNIQSYTDDTTGPPFTSELRAYYRWYVCYTYFGSYTYQTLAWVFGSYPPENPSCVKVDVKRIFI